MTRSPISGPKGSSIVRHETSDAPSTSTARPPVDPRRPSKIKDKAKLDKLKAPKLKVHHSPKATGGAHGAAHDGEEGAHEVGALEGPEGAGHAHHHQGAEVEAPEQEDEVHEPDEGHETAATGADAVKRAKGDAGGGDGFEGGRDQREAYERWMRGRVGDDQDRIAKLKARGAKDDFDADRTPLEVEALGTHRAVAHVVRLHESWALAGVSREDAIAHAAQFLAGFSATQNIRRVLAQLESNPIRDVYPLEVLMKLLDDRPELLPGVRAGRIVANAETLADGAHVFAGHPVRLEVPVDVRIKSFALLGGGRPGYEFHPHKDEGVFQLLVDTPGRFTFALLAAPLQQLARIQRETSEAMLEVFSVNVHAMGKKGEPLSAEQWAAQVALDDDGRDLADDESDGRDGEAQDAHDAVAPSLAAQVRGALELIQRDEPTDGQDAAVTATTYSWEAALFRPGSSLLDEPLLRLSIRNAAAFDGAWAKARQVIVEKQREWEPSRAAVTAEDFTAALRCARYR